MNIKNGNKLTPNKSVKDEIKPNTTGENGKHKITNMNDINNHIYSDNNKNGHKKNNTNLSKGKNLIAKENQVLNMKDKQEKPPNIPKNLHINTAINNFTFGSKYSNLLNLKPYSPMISAEKKKLESESVQENLNYNGNEFDENVKKLKETIQIYSHNVRKNEGGSVNTLFKIRTVLLNWLKDSEQDNLEYSKFMTEKKIKYLLKNKEKMENKMKILASEIILVKTRKDELEATLGEFYISYEAEELEQEIERFSNSFEIRTGKSKRMAEKLEEMKKMLPLVKEYNIIKEQEVSKTKEKNEFEKICKSSVQTLGFLSNYYKNLRKKINDLNN